MGNFTKAESDTHQLKSGKGWFAIQRNLNIFDQRRMETAAHKPVLVEGSVYTIVDWSVYEIMRAEVWLTEWLMVDDNGKPVPLSLDAIKALDPETFNEISDTILARILAIGEEKKTRMMQATKTEGGQNGEATSS